MKIHLNSSSSPFIFKWHQFHSQMNTEIFYRISIFSSFYSIGFHSIVVTSIIIEMSQFIHTLTMAMLIVYWHYVKNWWTSNKFNQYSNMLLILNTIYKSFEVDLAYPGCACRALAEFKSKHRAIFTLSGEYISNDIHSDRLSHDETHSKREKYFCHSERFIRFQFFKSKKKKREKNRETKRKKSHEIEIDVKRAFKLSTTVKLKINSSVTKFWEWKTSIEIALANGKTKKNWKIVSFVFHPSNENS